MQFEVQGFNVFFEVKEKGVELSRECELHCTLSKIFSRPATDEGYEEAKPFLCDFT